MILLLLAACGADPPLDQPSPPPSPPPALAGEPGVITHAGTVADVSPATRSWVSTGEGKRQIAHLIEAGTLTIDGKPATVADLGTGMSVSAEGTMAGDLLLVRAATATSAPPAGTEPAPAPTPP